MFAGIAARGKSSTGWFFGFKLHIAINQRGEAYNVLAVLQAAVRATHDVQAAGIDLSSYYFAVEVKAHYAGMMVAVALAAWRAYDALTAQQLGQMLMHIAAHADPMALRKHPRGPKGPNKKGYAPAAVARRHVSTNRGLKEGRVN